MPHEPLAGTGCRDRAGPATDYEPTVRVDLRLTAAERDRSCGEATVRIALHERIGHVVGRAACGTDGRPRDRPLREHQASSAAGNETIHGEIAGRAHWLDAASHEPD